MTKNRQSYRLDNGKIIPIEDPSKKKEEERNNFVQGIGLASDLGFAIAFPIAGGALLGSFLDTQYKSTPKITLILISLGLIISFINIINIVKKNTK